MDENKKNETEMIIKHSFSNKDFNNYIKLDDIIIDKVDLINIDKKSTSNKKYKIKYKIILNDNINNNDFKSSIIKNNDDENKYKSVVNKNIYDNNDLKITNINEEIKAMEQHEKTDPVYTLCPDCQPAAGMRYVPHRFRSGNGKRLFRS